MFIKNVKHLSHCYQKNRSSIYVKEIYRPFKQQEISDQIAKIITPAGTVAEVEVIYQTLDNLTSSLSRPYWRLVFLWKLPYSWG
jgi:hypothetical protein